MLILTFINPTMLAMRLKKGSYFKNASTNSDLQQTEVTAPIPKKMVRSGSKEQVIPSDTITSKANSSLRLPQGAIPSPTKATSPNDRDRVEARIRPNESDSHMRKDIVRSKTESRIDSQFLPRGGALSSFAQSVPSKIETRADPLR